MNLWRLIKMQAALALFVAAAMTQLAHAGLRPDDRPVGSRTSIVTTGNHGLSQQALKAMGERWNATAASYGVQASDSGMSQQALKALGERWTAIAESYGARPASSYYSRQALVALGQRYQAQADRYQSFRTDFPAAQPEPGPATTGYVVGGQLRQPGTVAQPAVHGALRPDDRGGIRGGGDQQPVTVTSGGFDWTDAGIGALGAFGLCLLAAGCMALAVSHRRHRLAVL